MQCIVYPIKMIRRHPKPGLWIANVGSFQVVVGSEPDGRCHYEHGQLGFFIPEGAVVPDKLAKEMLVFGMLAGKKKDTVRAKQRQGIASDGLFYGSQGESWNPAWKEGDDVTDEVGITFKR